MSISATYTFSPTITGGSISVTGNTESEVKAAVKTQLETRKATAAGQIANIDTALTGMDS